MGNNYKLLLDLSQTIVIISHLVFATLIFLRYKLNYVTSLLKNNIQQFPLPLGIKANFCSWPTKLCIIRLLLTFPILSYPILLFVQYISFPLYYHEFIQCINLIQSKCFSTCSSLCLECSFNHSSFDSFSSSRSELKFHLLRPFLRYPLFNWISLIYFIISTPMTF